jgi:heme A synthase
MPPSRPAFRRLVWIVLGVTLAVVAWGGLVRATGSGAGCGNHWPVCNGEVVPHSPSTATLIEYTHRASSGLVLVLTLALFLWGRRGHVPGNPVRTGVTAVLVFMLTEAAVGALLVLNRWVGLDASVARALAVSAHLANTFFLLGALALTTEWVRGDQGLPRAPRWPLLLATGALLLVGVSGAIAALGDTLFPARSLSQGLAQDVAPTSHFLLRLRSWHPFLAVLTGALVVACAEWLSRRAVAARWLAVGVSFMVLTQLGLGMLNLVLLAPVPLQLLHLLVADLLWVLWVKLLARASPRLSPARSETAPHAALSYESR